MAGMSEEASARFAQYFPPCMAININDFSQATKAVLDMPTKGGAPLQWGNSNIGVGLLRALQKKVPIEFSDAPSDDRFTAPQGDHLVVCEDDNEFSQVIAANYAHSIGAGLFLIKAVDKESAEALCEEFYGANDNRQESMSSILERLRDQLRALAGDIPMTGVRGITFISKAMPWGFAFPEVPTTHLFIYPDLGISIINGVAAEQPNSPKMRMAAMIDPATIPSTEVEKIAKSLAKRGLLVRGFRGSRATVSEISKMLELLPYELLLIATHCGDASGWRETYHFTDSEGKAREFIVDTACAVAFEPDQDEQEVIFFHRHVTLDGVAWNDKPALKKISGTAVKDFYALGKNERVADAREEISRVPNSAAMQMFDGNILLTPRGLGDNLTPVILNNACTSWHQLADRFMFGNARAYIGTLIPVLGVEAKEVAEQILEKHFGKPLAVALWHAQNATYKTGIRRPYLLVGVHYQRLTSCYDRPHGYLLKRMTKNLSHWQKHFEETSVENENKRMLIMGDIDFLEREIDGLRKLSK